MCLQEIVEVVINQCLELKEVTDGELFGYCLFFLLLIYSWTSGVREEYWVLTLLQ